MAFNCAMTTGRSKYFRFPRSITGTGAQAISLRWLMRATAPVNPLSTPMHILGTAAASHSATGGDAQGEAWSDRGKAGAMALLGGWMGADTPSVSGARLRTCA